MNKLIGVLITAAILFGVAACSVPAEATPAETVTVTATATVTPEPVIKREYVETVKEVTPQVCIETVDLMAQYLGLVAETGPLYGDGTKAAYDHDSAALGVVSSKLEILHYALDGVSKPLKTASEACRAKGK